jgi:hypothetical protein
MGCGGVIKTTVAPADLPLLSAMRRSGYRMPNVNAEGGCRKEGNSGCIQEGRGGEPPEQKQELALGSRRLRKAPLALMRDAIELIEALPRFSFSFFRLRN